MERSGCWPACGGRDPELWVEGWKLDGGPGRGAGAPTLHQEGGSPEENVVSTWETPFGLGTSYTVRKCTRDVLSHRVVVIFTEATGANTLCLLLAGLYVQEGRASPGPGQNSADTGWMSEWVNEWISVLLVLAGFSSMRTVTQGLLRKDRSRLSCASHCPALRGDGFRDGPWG